MMLRFRGCGVNFSPDFAHRRPIKKADLKREPSHWKYTELRGGGAHSEIRGAHSCPPGGWSGAGVGVGMLRGAGDSLT